MTVTLIRKFIPVPKRPTADQLRDHIVNGGFISRGKALAILQFTNSEHTLVRFVWLVDDHGRWQRTDELERPGRIYDVEGIHCMIVFDRTNDECAWTMSDVEISYT